MNPIRAFLTTNLTKILGGFLGVSLLCNLGLYLYGAHYHKAYDDCKTAVVVTTAVAKEKKVQTEKRNETITKNADDRTTTRVGVAIERLRRNEARSGNLPVASGGTTRVESPGETPVVLPGVSQADIEKEDREICVTNTILLEEFQKFYSEIRESMTPEVSKSMAPVDPGPSPTPG